MPNFLLDFVFPISVVTGTPAASTAFLKQVIVVALPKSGQEGNVGKLYECTTMDQVAARIDENGPSYVEVEQLFAAGMSRVYILLAEDLDIGGYLTELGTVAYTVLISSDFGDDALDGEIDVPAVKASRKIQDITWTAKEPGEEGNDITVTYGSITPAVKSEKQIQDILYRAKTPGVDGDNITVTYTNTKVDGSAEVTSVVGTAITVAIEAGATTAAAIAAAVESHNDANALVELIVALEDAANTQTESGVDGVALEGGADASHEGQAAVEVAGTDISVYIYSGVTTAQDIVDAVEAEGDSNALVECAIDEDDEDDAQSTSGVSALSLEGGADATTVPSEIDVGTWQGVVGYASTSRDVARAFGTAPKRSGWFRSEENGSKNMFYAFGALLGNLANWTNLQYASMPANDGVATLGAANALFDDRVSFALSDDNGNKLGFFVAGRKAITAPYIVKSLEIDLQSAALQWISANQPTYTVTEAALLENRLQEDVINARYIQPPRKWLRDGRIEITLVEDNFVGQAQIDIAEPNALWKIVGQLTTSL